VAGRHFPDLAAGVSRAPWSSLVGGANLARGVYLLRLERTDGSSEHARVTVTR
jgi:hypothetical protein